MSTSTKALSKLLNVAVSTAGTGVIAGLVLWQVTVLGVDGPLGPIVPLFFGLLLLLGLSWGSIIIHEFGHLLAALAVGLRVQMVVLGPLKVTPEDGRFRVRINWRSTTPGYVMAFPADTRALRPRMLIYIAAGPLASLVSGLLLLVPILAWNEPAAGDQLYEVSVARFPWLPQNHTVAWLYMASVLNLTVFLQAMIPGLLGGLTSDGGQLVSLLRGGTGATRHLVILNLTAASVSGVRPRDWPAAAVEEILAERDGSADDISADLYGYYHALDRGQLEEAGELLDRAVAERQSYVTEFRALVLLEAAWFEARHRLRGDVARAWLDRAKQGDFQKTTRLRAEAAVLLAEGCYVEAMAKARAGLESLTASVDSGGAIAEREWLAAVLTESQERQAHPLGSDRSLDPGEGRS